MSRFCIILLIGVSLNIYSQCNEPLNKDEAIAWIQAIDMNTLAELVIDYDCIEHGKPKIDLPEMLLIESHDYIYVKPEEPAIINISRFKWEFKIPTNKYKKKVDNFDITPYIIVGIGCFSAGFIIARLIP